MERGGAEQRGLEPLGRLVSYGFAGVEPRYMGVGPVPAVRNALAKAGLGVEDMGFPSVARLCAAWTLRIRALVCDVRQTSQRSANSAACAEAETEHR